MRFCLTWSGSLGNRTTATVMASAMNLFALLRASVLPAASSHAGLTDGSGLYGIPRCLHAESCSHRESAFEHPAGATSWSQDCVDSVRKLPGVFTVVFDQCMLGLVSKVNRIPMRKRTRIMTNSYMLASHLKGRLCDKSHEHQQIQGTEGGMKRSVWAQLYPPGLVHCLVQGTQQQLRV